MPIYEYECKSCNSQYEYLIRGKDQGPPDCPRCGSHDVQKLISSASIVRSPAQKQRDRTKALSGVNPANPQEVAGYFKEHGSRFGDSDFRGTKAWSNAVDRVAEGGPTLEEK